MTLFDSQKKPTIQWDEYRRQVLCCLFRFFHEDGKDFERIFSEFFKEHLLDRGFPKGFIAYRVLYAQWTWMRRTDHSIWKFVHLETEFRTDREWKHVVQIIKAIASRLGILLIEKRPEEDDPYRRRISKDLEGSKMLLSTEEAVNLLVEELTSISPLIEPRSPESILTSSRRPHELSSRLTPETPTPSNIHLPTISRYWPRDDEIAWQPEQEAIQTPVSMPRCENVLGSSGLNEKAASEESEEPEEHEEPAPCKGTLWGLPCFWCHKDRPIEPDDEQHMAMEAAAIESCNRSTEHGSPLDIDGNLQHLDGQCSDEQVSMDFSFANSRMLPGLCTPESLPPVLYRWSNIHSQGINTPTRIVAGMFAHPHSIAFPPPDFDEGLFLDYVKAHVTKKPVSSPFISAFKGLLAPIHRALRNGEEAKVSIIDTSQMITEIFKAAPLVELTKTALPNWKGFGEYLIWHEVPTAAIACTFTISRLEHIVSQHPDISQFLQLDLIRRRDHCTRFLYSDLAANMPSTQDGFEKILDKLTSLLGVRENVKDLVALQFKHTWTEKFCGIEYQKPGANTPILSESEAEEEPEPEPAPPVVQVLLGPPLRKTSPTDSDCTWQPRREDSEDDSGSSTSDSGESEGSEEVLECPRLDTPSDGYYSVDDESSVDWRRHSPVDDEDIEMAEEHVEMVEEDWDSEDEWPSEEEMPDAVPVHWST